MWSTRLGKLEIQAFSSNEFHSLKKEIFSQDQYSVELDTNTPRILDIGAHIGLASLYFLQLFPAAQIEAYEPNPGVFAILEQNLSQNFVKRVATHRLAVSSGAKTLSLHVDTSSDQWWSTGSAVPGGWTGTQTTKASAVPAVPLSTLLEQNWDLIKMDIEAQELEVLSSAKLQLGQASQWLVEYHPVPGQTLEQLIKLFKDTGFKVELRKNGQVVNVHHATGLVVVHAFT